MRCECGDGDGGYGSVDHSECDDSDVLMSLTTVVMSVKAMSVVTVMVGVVMIVAMS